MKRLIDEINNNYSLFDFLHNKYVSYIAYEGNNVKFYCNQIEYDKEYVKEYRNKIDWQKISESAPLSEDDIDLYFHELRQCLILVQYGPAVECLFSTNTNIKWTKGIIEKYQKHLHWPSICKNPSVPWNEELIDKYLVHKYNNISNWLALSSNPSIQWNEYLLSKYFSLIYLNCIIKYNKTFWSKALLKSTLELVSNDNKRLYLVYFSEIENVEWDLNLLLDFPIDYSYWVFNITKSKTLSLTFEEIRLNIARVKNELFEIIQTSEDLKWNIDLISEFQDKINFKTLSRSANVDWSIELIELFEERLDFRELSSNTSLFVTDVMIRKFKEKWDFDLLSANVRSLWNESLIVEFVDLINLNEILEKSNINVNEEFVDKYKSKICWEGEWRKFGSDSEWYYPSTISTLKHVPISVETLKKCARNWHKGGNNERDTGDWYYFSMNNFLKDEHLKEFEDYLFWNLISANRHLDITNAMIIKYASKWDYSELFKRDDIKWEIETFIAISKYLNWDILMAFDSKILDIIKPLENVILNHFTYGRISSFTLHSESWNSYFFERRLNDIIYKYEVDLCQEAINEINGLNIEDINEIWSWLKTFQPLYYKYSHLSSDFNREPKDNGGKLRKFFFEYERLKIKLVKLYEKNSDGNTTS